MIEPGTSVGKRREPVFFIEPTNKCNLKCAMCPTNREMKREKGFLQFDLFATLVEDISKDEVHQKRYLNLWGWGEPFLHPRIYDMTALAAERGFDVRISTNLEVIDPASIDNLLTSGIATLFIGLDGMSDTTHSAYRIGGSVESVLSLIKGICSRRHAIGPRAPRVVLTTLLTKQALLDLEEIEGFCKGVGVDALMLKYPNLWRSTKTSNESIRLYQQFLEGGRGSIRYRLGDESQAIVSSSGPCPFTNKNGIVLWNGDLVPCCFDHDGSCTYTNISGGNSYSEVLASEKWEKFQDSMRNKQFPICASCDSCGPRRDVILFNRTLETSDFLKFA